MGFNWGFLAVKRTGAGVAGTVLASLGFSADATHRHMRADARRLFQQASELEKERKGMGRSFLVTELDSWTFFESSSVMMDTDIARLARELNADVCWAYAISTSWSLGAEYARPDGTTRTKGFYLDVDLVASGSDAFGVRQVRDKAGRAVGFEMVPRALIGPRGELIPPERVGKEYLLGPALPGESAELKVCDDESLIRFLVKIGVPIGAVLDRRYCSVPDMVSRDYPGNVAEACLAGIRRDSDVLAALGNNGRTEDGSWLYLSGPLVRAGKFGLEQPKRSFLSRLMRKPDPVAT
ncbi:MAG: hypothetical protein SA339_02150 [Methanomassiliicoccus sp.]|nr:hypothetical protein [Methanomassiliicoccus sp.]